MKQASDHASCFSYALKNTNLHKYLQSTYYSCYLEYRFQSVDRFRVDLWVSRWRFVVESKRATLGRSEAPRRRRARIPWVSDSGLGYVPGIRADKNNVLSACVHRPKERRSEGENLLWPSRHTEQDCENTEIAELTCPRGWTSSSN